MDLVVWGHEHECLIEPRYNAEQGFHVMQPGSSVATSLMPGEAVPKHVAILKVTGKEFKVEPILLKSVRPFIMKEIVLAEEPALKNLWKKDNNRTEITRHLIKIVEELIEEAKQQWRDVQVGEITGEEPLPLIRLRVEYSAPDGGRFDCENPQRFSNRFTEKVANESDVVQFYRKKTTKARQSREDPEMPEDSVLEQLSLDSVKVEKLVREFLNAQSLTVLPQDKFGKAVGEFVDKDDKHSVDAFLLENLKTGINFMMKQQSDQDESDDEDAAAEKLAKTQSHLAGLSEDAHKRARKHKFKPKPEHWDTDLDGEWEEQPAAYIPSDLDDDGASVISDAPSKVGATRGRGRGRGARTAATGTTRKAAAAPKKAAPAARGGRSKKTVVEEDDDDSDIQMLSNNEDDEDDDLFVRPAKSTAKKPVSKTNATTTRQTATTRKTAATKQSTLDFSQQTQRAPPSSGRVNKPIEIVGLVIFSCAQ
jgi:double-strand break repair protein MRE11